MIKDPVIFLFFNQGFDEYMNLVLDDAEEVNIKKKTRKTLGMPNFLKFCFFVFATRTCIFWSLLLFNVLIREDPSQRRQHNFNDEHVSEIKILVSSFSWFSFLNISELVFSYKCSSKFQGQMINTVGWL